MTDIKPDLAITDLPNASPSDPLEALSWLGETVEEVAEGLRARGIKGIKHDAHACPLARYLRIWWPNAGHAHICWTGTALDGESNGMPLSLPQCIAFELQFDWGQYPDLIDNG